MGPPQNMKQIYIKPSTEIIELDIETHLMALSADDALDGTTYGGTATDKSADAPGRRGEWGNLWADM